jgi:hypothetical protein
VEAGTGSAGFTASVPSGAPTALPAVAGKETSTVPPNEGIDTSNRRNPAATKTLLKTHPSMDSPRKII